MLKKIAQFCARLISGESLTITSKSSPSRRTILRLEELEDRTLLSTYLWTGPDGGAWNNMNNWTVLQGTKRAMVADNDSLVFDGNRVGSCKVGGKLVEWGLE